MQAVPPPIPDDDDPYRPPQSQVVVEEPSGVLTLASRGQRLGATVLDFVPAVVLGISFAAFLPAMKGNPDLVDLALLGVVAFVIVLGIVNLVGIYRSGQTIGKRLVGIRVVRSNGERCSFGRYIGLRWFAMALVGNIPLIGPFISLLDVLLIFRADHKCLHDDFADTIVIVA